MAKASVSTYSKTHRLKGKVLNFILGSEDDDLRERAESARTGRAAKTMVKEGPLSITIVALKKGASLQSHQVAGPVSIQSLRGCLRLTTDSGDLDLPVGGLVVLDAGVAHAATAIDDCALLITLAIP